MNLYFKKKRQLFEYDIEDRFKLNIIFHSYICFLIFRIVKYG